MTKMNDENLVKEQMKVIDKLQDKINLLKFDISENLKEIVVLKRKLNNRNENIKNIRAELMSMKRKNDFTDINKVIAMVNDGWYEHYEE
jgi:maltodextrin utilization protein YvdJ